MTRSHQKSGSKRKTQSSPAPQVGSSRNVRPRLAQSSPAPALRSSPPPLLESNVDPFHPENVNWPSKHEDVGLWLGTVATSDFRLDPALVVRTIQKIINIDLHWESILEVQGRRMLAYLDITEAPEDLKQFVHKTLRDQLSFKLCWILGGKVKNAAHLAQQLQTLHRASEAFHGPLVTPDHRELFQELTSAWSSPAAGPTSGPLRGERRLDLPTETCEVAEPSNREPHTNLRPEHQADRGRAFIPADGARDPLPEAPSAPREESSSSRTQPNHAPVPVLQPDDPPRLDRQNDNKKKPPPDLKRMDRSGVKRSLAPRVAWFLDEEYWRKVKGDFFPSLLIDATTLWAWYKLGKLVEAAGTSNAYKMHVELFWRALHPDARDAWENRFARIRIDRIPIEHIRQRLEISGASLASFAPASTNSHTELPAPLNPSPAAAPTTSSQQLDMNVEVIDLSRDDDEPQKGGQNTKSSLDSNPPVARLAGSSAKTTTPGQSSRRKDQRPENLSGERCAATPKLMARRVTPAPTQSHRHDARPVTHGSYSGALQRSQQGAGRSSNQPRPTEPANSAKPSHKSFTAINRSRSRGPSTQPPNVGTSQRNAPSSGPLNSQNGPKKFRRSNDGRFRGKIPFAPP